MKPQKKAIVAQKAPKSQPVAKNRNKTLSDKLSVDSKKDNKVKCIDNTKKSPDSEQKKLEKFEKCKKIDEKKRKESKVDKMDDKKKLNKDVEKKCETVDEKKFDKMNDRGEELMLDMGCGAIEKKKNVKSDDKVKIDKQLVDSGKKKIEKGDDKKKVGKEDALENDSSSNTPISDESRSSEEKSDIQNSLTKKKGLKDDEKKKKDGRSVKSELKESLKNTATKDKKLDVKKIVESNIGKKSKSVIVKKDLSPKNSQKKLSNTKKTVIIKKTNTQLAKKLVEKKSKLVKSAKDENSMSSEENEESPKAKKKSSPILKSKINLEKKPKLAKQMKVKLPQKNGKINNILKKEKLKKITDKIVMRKKMEMKEDDKVTCDSNKKILKEDQQTVQTDNIKKEICNDKEDDETLQAKSPDSRKCSKSSSKPRAPKKFTKKSTKSVKSHDEDYDKVSPKTEDTSISDSSRQTKNEESGVKSPSNPKRDTENPIKTDLKVESSNGDSSENQTSPSDSDNDYVDELEARRNRQKKKKKIEPDDNDENNGEDEDDRDEDSSDDEQKRMRLLDFWSGPKRRVASLNALAKVHCMYENEAGGVYLGGYCKPKPEKDKPKKAPSTAAAGAITKDDKEESSAAVRKEKENKKSDVVGKSTSVNNVSKRNLRNVPGLRGKHWDMIESSSSSSSSSTSDEDESVSEQIVEKIINKRGRKKNTTSKKKKNEEVMDLKDMVVCKRMASLNASAMLAASYSDEKHRNSSSSESSSDSEVEIIKRRKQQGDTEADRRKARQDEEAIKAAKKVVIVNQDTDVTITGVYVNQTRSTHHEGFCSIAGMQYRISSTSHTQTAATAVAAELHEQQKIEPPCKSYTPLGALSSMQPPGSQGSHPDMSPRRHSAFTAPHQHGYYQPAGPLIQHPPTLPPIKGPPPEPTPTPPQNSEGSDDLVATSTTSGGTNSTGNSWRSYRKTESRVASSAIPSTSIVPTGGGFYRAYCPQYYGTPPQYQELCYPPTYPHPHSHPPPYYKYAPAYRRQYYGYPEAGGGAVAGGAGAGAPPGVVEYPPPPPPGEYPMPPYYGGYPPPPPPPPPPPNPAYLHSQGRPIVDHAAFQGCPCPMQSCPKNVDTGPLIGNGKGAPVASGPGLSLPPSALVGPPSPARGLAGLAPPHGANAWDTDRVQLNNHRNLNQNQQLPTSVAQHNIVNEHCRSQNNECRTKDEKTCTDDKMSKCSCQKRACTSTCEVKLETLSPVETTEIPSPNLPTENLRELKLENNNVKCESCSVSINDNISCAANCNVKCETTDFKCEIIKCEQCMKEGQMAILEIDKDSGILLIDDKLEAENGVKEELNDVVVVESQNWIKPDYEATVTETIEENDNDNNDDNNERTIIVDELPKCQKVVKRKLSLDSLSSNPKKRKVNKRTLSVGSSLENSDRVPNPMNDEYFIDKNGINDDEDDVDLNSTKKKIQLKKESSKRKIDDVNSCDSAAKKSKSTKHTISNGITHCLKSATTDISIMETINDVIEQSVQMTNKKDIKCKQEREKIDKKKKTVSLLSIIKKVPKTLVKAVVNEKMCISKNEMKNIKELKTNKIELQNNKIKIPENNKCKNKVKAKIVEMKSKVFDSKVKAADIKMKELTKKIDTTSKTKLVIDDKCEDIKKAALVKKKRKSTKKTSGKKSCGKIDDDIIVDENCSLTKKPFLKPKWSNGWSWEGESYEAKVYLTNEESAIRRCYESMRHVSGDVLRPRDCVLLKSGPRKADLPFVAKIAALWENPDDGEMMFSLLWYYRPEHTEQGRTDYDTEDEVFASRHRDANSVACIEDKCYILTFNEYCRYRKNLRRSEEGLDCPGLIVPPGEHIYPRESRQPPIPVPSDIVLFCRRVYDYRGKKLVKNPG